MPVFASVDTFVESSQKSLKLGRLVANFEFFQALLRHGSFDRYHLFCPSVADLGSTRAAFERIPGIDARRLAFSTHVELPAWLAREDFSVFHVGGWSHYLPRLAWLRARYARRPMALTGVIHSLNTPEIPVRFRQFLDAPLGAADSVVCTTHAGREVFSRYISATQARLGAPDYPGRLDVIPLGVADAYFAPRERSECRTRLGLPASGVQLLYLGRISAYSKADLAPLLYCFRTLLDRATGERDLRLLLAGGGDEATLRSLRETAAELGIADRVHLRPNVEDDEKLLLYGAADIFVSPIDNHQETFGISIVEAMAAGLPVVASDFDGYRELIVEGETGFRIASLWARPPEIATSLRGILEPNVAQLLVSQGVALDQRALFDRLALLADQPGLRTKLGAAGRTRAQAEFAWSAVIARYEALWTELGRAASAASWPPPPAPADPDIVDLYDVFGHYPSAILAPSDTLSLAPLAEAVLGGRIPMPATYEDIGALCDGRVMTLIVYSLREQARTLEELSALAGTKLGAQADIVSYVALWLLKYGLIERRG